MSKSGELQTHIPLIITAAFSQPNEKVHPTLIRCDADGYNGAEQLVYYLTRI